MAPQLLLYMPVIHAGYERLLEKWGNHAEVLVLGQSFASEYKTISKEIRALKPERVVKYLASSGVAPDCRVIEVDDLPHVINTDLLILPDEEVMRDIVRRYDLSRKAVIRTERTFLRWDRTASLRRHEPAYEARVGLEETNRIFGRQAEELAQSSSDWWRQVGAVAVRQGHIVQVGRNVHHPTEYSPYINGDPRNNFSRGRQVEASTALHAEAALVAQSARSGVSLDGSDLYVSTFPCPTCARLIVASGVARCFYSAGYSMLDGEGILAAGGVSVIFVDLSSESNRQMSLADAAGHQLAD